MAALISWISTDSTKYNALTTKNEDAIYFLSDTGEIFKGTTLYSSSIILVDTLPSTGIPKKIYIVNSTLQCYIWNGTAFEPTSKQTIIKTPSFIISSTLTAGVQPILIKMDQDGIINNVSAICSTAGTDDCEISIEKISETDFDTNTNWSSIFTTNLTIPSGKFSNITSQAYVLKSNIINKGDVLRLNVIKSGTTITGLNVELSIQIN